MHFYDQIVKKFPEKYWELSYVEVFHAKSFCWLRKTGSIQEIINDVDGQVGRAYLNRLSEISCHIENGHPLENTELHHWLAINSTHMGRQANDGAWFIDALTRKISRITFENLPPEKCIDRFNKKRYFQLWLPQTKKDIQLVQKICQERLATLKAKILVIVPEEYGWDDVKKLTPYFSYWTNY